MSIAEQALFLVDLSPNLEQRRKLEAFSDLEQTISASFASPEACAKEAEQSPQSGAFSVAARLSRSNYEDQARAEALMHALRRIRVSNVQTPRVIRRA